MVRPEHKDHIILWERADKQAYLHIPRELLTPEKCKAIKEDKKNKHGFNEFKAILKNEGFDVE